MRLLLIEDNQRLAGSMRDALTELGFIVDMAPSIQGFEDARSLASYSLYVLDLGLPDGEGLSLIRQLRRKNDASPIFVVSGRTLVHDRVQCLEAGADDFITKPFHRDEFVARVRALLRRPAAIEGTVVRAGELLLHVETLEVFCGEHPLPLRLSERRLLALLMRRSGRIVSRATIESSVQETANENTPNAIDKLVSRLRRILHDLPVGIELRTIKGAGYVLEERS